ncbi:MAG: carbon-nitrogen hydrolase family protein [Myxococcota bacterium]|jgi:predicted amidohydrolase|nr:hydrolase [Deltaproteobacteria bacterium]MCP4242256.1 carbon-nitrogen hydrolase family protein [bacterium]MDP6075257.1 carbon-nitrogen hydrolase family protein [Myxococcota bacterium]MDP6244319.1 carbon-nitrogen hydrolase family protein [Myxococcota bacterium]MDP7074256.1 carbon-nitrogen hydrolase family protein [Myxococcota bacterium]
MHVAIVQMNSTDDLPANLAAAERFVDAAALLGVEFVALPENFAYLRREGLRFPCAQGLDGEIVGAVRAWARRHRLRILGGTFPEVIPGEDRVYNTSVLIGPDGAVEAVYRKIHLFDVRLGAGAHFTESASIAPGKDVVVADTPAGGIGLSVCYDLRFPELYRAMAARGDVRFLCVPSAFTPETGKDHWEILLRARAIENQAFVLAPAQCGRHSENRASYGRSLIVDPWGLILAQAGDRPGVITAVCDLRELERSREQLPALKHRKLT